MSASPDISGIVAWARREEWREAFNERLERHAGPACAAAGIELPEIGAILGVDVVNMVWGATFEDLLTVELADGRNLADDYLRRRGWKESLTTRDYIAGLRHSRMGLYEVVGIKPGEWIRLRDLVCGGEPVQVMERLGSEGVRLWDHVASRVVPLRGRNVLGGVLMGFDHRDSEGLQAGLRRVGKRVRQEAARLARKSGMAVEESPFADMLTPDRVLRESAFLFTNRWLTILLREAQGLDRPQLVNTDGDPLAFTRVHFRLRPGVTAEEIRRALSGLSALQQESPDLWKWLKSPESASQTTPSGRNARNPAPSLGSGSVVLGTVSLEDSGVTLETNSTARAERGRKILASAIGRLVEEPLTERINPDADETHCELPRPAGLSPDQQKTLVSQALDDHYRRVVDEPVPALGGRSPRAAARTPKGREKVAAWLKTLENRAARQPPDDPIANYDFSWMWRELGVEELRR